eukprot:7401103-Alexandrium_andersonii.AAC.1
MRAVRAPMHSRACVLPCPQTYHPLTQAPVHLHSHIRSHVHMHALVRLTLGCSRMRARRQELRGPCRAPGSALWHSLKLSEPKRL